MPKVFEYQLIKNDEVVFKGLKHEVMHRLKCLGIEIDNAYKHGYELYGYKIDRRKTQRRYTRRIFEPENKEEIIIKKDKTIDYLVKHIKEYGNVAYAGSQPAKYKKMLCELGYNVTYRRVKYKEDAKAWYVIERVKNE